MKFTAKSIALSYALLIGTSFAVISFTNTLILTPDFYKRSGEVLGFGGQDIMVYQSVQKYIYFFQALYLSAKLLLISLILYAALYLIRQTVPFVSIFGIVVLCEFIFVLSAILKLWWFHQYLPNGQLGDWHRTYLFSVLSILPNVPAAWYYPLQTLNLFEIAYWFLLGFGIARVTTMGYDRSLRLVVQSYLPALLVWVACVVFTTLLFFPNQG
jgi:hypothetical protein